MTTSQAVLEYFAALGDALELLSKGREGSISNLPSYALGNRRIKLGVAADGSAVAIKFEPDDSLAQDVIDQMVLTSVTDVHAIIAPFRTEARTLSDTIFWTYELLLAHARDRWNEELETQYRVLDLPSQRPF